MAGIRLKRGLAEVTAVRRHGPLILVERGSHGESCTDEPKAQATRPRKGVNSCKASAVGTVGRRFQSLHEKPFTIVIMRLTGTLYTRFPLMSSHYDPIGLPPFKSTPRRGKSMPWL